MTRETLLRRVDGALIERVAELPPGGQRWLKTMLATIRSLPDEEDREEPKRAPRAAQQASLTAGLEDVITGKASLQDQLAAYPELAEELEGLGEIINMLRDLGEHRRARGEQILREEILGEQPEAVGDEDPDFSA